MLQLARPLAFIDLETTGINLQIDKIVEIAIVKLMPDGQQVIKRKLINPEMPIPAATSAIHGITNEMVKDAPTFKQAANEIKQFLHNCDVAGFNSNRFDIPLLVEEFLRAGLEETFESCKLLDVQRIFHTMEQRTLSAAYKFYCYKTLDNAHSATADATATLEVLLAQLDKYKQLGDTVDSILQCIGKEEIVDYARRFIKQDGVEIFNFGKHKGKPVVEVLKQEPGYYDWMMRGDFSLHTKQKLTELLNKTLVKKNQPNTLF
ncbi:MAG TPA: 3'-5' exonuclease [Chitinophagaceae bacterium]|nr:3'-5' exonuclease [Chitinophagaceae bacterium]